jgi:hypothetical protein
MREAYALFGRRRDLTSLQDRLLDPHELRLDESGEVLVFREENQGVTSWGVPTARLAEPDPPVVFWLDALDHRGRGWRPFLDRFSLACVELVLSEALFADPVELSDDRAIDDGAVALLEERFTRSAIPDYPMWTGGGSTRWFTGADVILRDDADTWVWVRARTPTALAATRAALPGDWSIGSQ